MSSQPRAAHYSAASAPAMLLTCLLLAFVIPIAAVARAAAPDDGVAAQRPHDAESGRLFFKGNDGAGFVAAPLVATDVEIKVSGLIARATVRQRFKNDGQEWVEGIYVFPLPENSAVDRMRLRIGERMVEGRIEERQQAQRVYQQARNEGRRAGLVEQERPNIFTTSLANVGPGEEIAVEIEYQEDLRYDQGTFSLRFPLVVAPRYIPGNPVVASARGWALPTNQVLDADRITPPVRKPHEGKGNPVTLAVQIDAGITLAAIESISHPIVTTVAPDGKASVKLRDPEVPADRDFVLSWRPETGKEPRAGLFVEERGDARHLLLMLMPPDPSAVEDTRRLARETIFVIDTSGSMAGASIVQAKTALKLAIDRLQSHDSFNVVQFNNVASALFGAAQPATPEAVRKAHVFVDALSANGGTEMLKALDLALDGFADPGRVRQVIFLTDGAVGNEAALFQRISDRLGDSRLFTVGIGSAPNGWFMREAARTGRGTFTHISRPEEVAKRVSALYSKLEHPVLTDLTVVWPGGVNVEGYPDPLPDLYAGEPVVLSARLPAGARVVGTTVEVRGKIAGAPWSAALALDGGADNAGVASLWARKKIDALTDGQRRSESPAAVREAALKVALGYGLVSKFTSLVAVDVTPGRAKDAPLRTAEVPTNLPDGWQYDKVFGVQTGIVAPPSPSLSPQYFAPPMRKTEAAPVSPAGGSAADASVQRAQEAAAARIGGISPGAPVTLPQTATHAQLSLLIGLLLLALALALLAPSLWRLAHPRRR